MVISDEERRDIAKRLREAKECTLMWLTDGELIGILAAVVDLDRYESKGFDEGLFERIAELVDRPIYRPNEMEGGVFCHQCGAEIGEYGVPNYCHNCGVAIRNASCHRELLRVQREWMDVMTDDKRG